MIYKLIYGLALVLLVNIQIANGITLYDVGLPEPKLVVLSKEYGHIYTYQEIYDLVAPKAKAKGVDIERIMYTIENESHFYNIQSQCHKSKTSNCDIEGKQEQSFGICQFNISNAGMSREQALDPDHCTSVMVEWFSEGKACRWTMYANKYGCNG